MTIKVYTAKHCGPCKDITKLIKEGKFEEKIELIDIETDKGFEEFTREVLEHGEGAVPSAYKDGKKCVIGYDEHGNIAIDCPTDDPPASE